MLLTPSQQAIADDIIACFARGSMRQELAGLAGTGKTTLVRDLYERLKVDGRHNVRVLAPTGKAAMVLASKGVPATTIHKAIYRFHGKVEDETGEIDLIFKDSANGRFCDLLIVDEASMVTQRMRLDIEGRCIPTLWVGDPGQLPPVKSVSAGLLDRPSHILREIHRQAADNPIIGWAHALRGGKGLTEPHTGIQRVAVNGQGAKRLAEVMWSEGLDRTIVKTNVQRVALNMSYREIADLSGPLQARDQIVCLMNNRKLGVVNGQIFTVVKVGQYWDDDRMYDCTLECQATGDQISTYVWAGQFHQEKQTDWDEVPEDAMIADYAYAMTCHKMQGSSEKRVGIVARGYCGETRTWNYTAATRAENHVCVFC